MPDPDEEPLEIELDEMPPPTARSLVQSSISQNKSLYGFKLTRKSEMISVKGKVDVYAFDDDDENHYFKRVNQQEISYSLKELDPPFEFQLSIGNDYDRVSVIVYGDNESNKNTFDYMFEQKLK